MIAWSLLLFPALATTADESTYLAKKASPCKKGEHAVGRAPFWWHSCKGQSGACPQSCGTCKKPNYSQTPAGQEPTCMCAGANQACTAECGYPGMVTKKNCAPIPCQQDDPVAAGCIDLEGNCGAGKSSLCVDAQGTQAECTFPATYSSSSPCQAFCREVLGTDKCETIRNFHDITVTKGVCPANAITKDQENTCAEDVTYLPSQFNKCEQLNSPYGPDSSSCKPTTKAPQVPDQSFAGTPNSKPPTTLCPSMKNRGSMGFPAFFTDLLVPPDASVTCQTACACNENEGFGPPSCFFSGEPFPGPTGCCYCNGKDIAYDKKSRDTCGHYLPIFGPETVPSQSACYHDYVTNPDHPGLVNKFPEPSPFTCEPDE